MLKSKLMTTFQAVLYGVIEAIGEFLPIGAKANHTLIPYLLGWPQPEGIFLGALSLGGLLALLIYFRHDWASMLSCFLQVILFRKRPMTLDERLPLFLGMTTFPLICASSYFHEQISALEWSPAFIAAVLAAFSLPLWFFDHMSRKNKGMFDWKWLDAFTVGLIQATALFPGWDHMSALLTGCFFLNYKREPAVKYAYYAAIPILLAQTVSNLKNLSFQTSMAMPDVSWLSFAVALIVTFFVSLLVIGGFTKHIQSKGMGQYVVYRFLLAAITVGAFWMKNRAN